jgi:hypothetical protein
MKRSNVALRFAACTRGRVGQCCITNVLHEFKHVVWQQRCATHRRSRCRNQVTQQLLRINLLQQTLLFNLVPTVVLEGHLSVQRQQPSGHVSDIGLARKQLLDFIDRHALKLLQRRHSIQKYAFQSIVVLVRVIAVISAAAVAQKRTRKRRQQITAMIHDNGGYAVHPKLENMRMPRHECMECGRFVHSQGEFLRQEFFRWQAVAGVAKKQLSSFVPHTAAVLR